MFAMNGLGPVSRILPYGFNSRPTERAFTRTHIWPTMHADGYARFNELYRRGKVTEGACMAHIWRKFVNIHKSQR